MQATTVDFSDHIYTGINKSRFTVVYMENDLIQEQLVIQEIRFSILSTHNCKPSLTHLCRHRSSSCTFRACLSPTGQTEQFLRGTFLDSWKRQVSKAFVKEGPFLKGLSGKSVHISLAEASHRSKLDINRMGKRNPHIGRDLNYFF